MANLVNLFVFALDRSSGAHVVIAGRKLDKGRQTEAELQAAGSSVFYVQADVAQPEQVAACVRATVERFGRLDYAFNNTATLSKLERTGDFTERIFEEHAALPFTPCPRQASWR